ncbi:lipocalin-like domain-containing protein [Pseudomonadota bacterium]
MIDKRIIGTWHLKSTTGINDSGELMPPPYGPTPNGVVCFQDDGRMYCVLCDGRSELPDDEARQFMSYAGNYSFDGNILTTRVDASSEATRIGTDQIRKARFESPGLILVPPRRLYAGTMQRQELFWERIA